VQIIKNFIQHDFSNAKQNKNKLKNLTNLLNQIMQIHKCFYYIDEIK